MTNLLLVCNDGVQIEIFESDRRAVRNGALAFCPDCHEQITDQGRFLATIRAAQLHADRNHCE